MPQEIKIAPSILASDFAHLADEIKKVEEAGADWLHLDVMDGHFVPNITIGPPVIWSLRKVTTMPFDVHLMLSDPLQYAQAFTVAGADLITFHIESVGDPRTAAAYIRSLGAKVGVAIKPRTPAEALLPYLKELDLVLVMTVEPGFGGQRFMNDMLAKIEMLRNAITRQHLTCNLQVDGGIDEHTAYLVKKAGADVLVAGSAIFGREDYKSAISILKNA